MCAWLYLCYNVHTVAFQMIFKRCLHIFIILKWGPLHKEQTYRVSKAFLHDIIVALGSLYDELYTYSSSDDAENKETSTAHNSLAAAATLPMILSIWTGAEEIPPLGHEPTLILSATNPYPSTYMRYSVYSSHKVWTYSDFNRSMSLFSTVVVLV